MYYIEDVKKNIVSVAISPDSKKLGAVIKHGRYMYMRQYDLESGKYCSKVHSITSLPDTRIEYIDNVTCLVRNKNEIIIDSDSNTIKINESDFKKVNRTLGRLSSVPYVNGFFRRPGGLLMHVGTFSGAGFVNDDMGSLKTIDLNLNIGTITNISELRDGGIMVGNSKGEVVIYNKDLNKTNQLSLAKDVSVCKILESNKNIVVFNNEASSSNSISIIDKDTMEVKNTTLKRTSFNTPMNFFVSPDGDKVGFVSIAYKTHILDTNSMKLYTNSRGDESCAIDNKGYIYSASYDAGLKVLELDKELKKFREEVEIDR